MIIGNLSEVLENEKSIYEALNDNIITQRLKINNGLKKGAFGKILKSLSNYGMNWDEDVMKNMQAIPADKALQPKDDFLLQQSLYGSSTNNWKVKGEEERKFAEKIIPRIKPFCIVEFQILFVVIALFKLNYKITKNIAKCIIF